MNQQRDEISVELVHARHFALATTDRGSWNLTGS